MGQNGSHLLIFSSSNSRSVAVFAFLVLNTLLVSSSQQQEQRRALIPPELLVDNNLYHVVPQGVILLWSGPARLVPRGWAVCDGTQGTPDLRDRFVMGSGPNAQFSVGQKGGASSVTPIVTVYPTHLTIAQMPEHSHGGSTSTDGTDGICYDQHMREYKTTSLKNVTELNDQSDKLTLIATDDFNKVSNCQHRHTIKKQGNDEPHFHEASASPLDTMPPFHALVYIMKL